MKPRRTPGALRAGALVSEVEKAKGKGICRSVDGYQTQDSSRPSTATDGTAGAAGCPEHNAPEHGRRGDETGSFSDCPDRSGTNGSIRDGSCQESARELTRCEQPPSAMPGADNAECQDHKSGACRKSGRSFAGQEFHEFQSDLYRQLTTRNGPTSRNFKKLEDIQNGQSVRKWPLIFSEIAAIDGEALAWHVWSGCAFLGGRGIL